MTSEFDLKVLNKFLDSFQMKCPENESLIEKLEGLCKIYKKSMEEISDDIISIMENSKKATVDSNVLSQLEEVLEKEAQKIAHTPKSTKRPARVPLSERSGFTLSGAPDDERTGQLSLSSSAVSKLEGHFLEFSPFLSSPANMKFLKRVEKGGVYSTSRGKKYTEKGLKPTSKTEEKVAVISKDPKLLYGGEKSSMVIQAKSKRMGDFAQLLQNTFEEIVDWGNPLIPSVDAVFTYGQIVHDESKDNKFGEHSVALMINDEDGTLVHLNVSKMTAEFTFFPGQIVAVRGFNETGDELWVDQVFTPPALPVSKIGNDTTKEIWFASGPFTAMDNCGYEHLCELLDKVVLEKPDILILAGPFIDRRNTFLSSAAFTNTYDNLLEDLLMKIKQKLQETKTEVIIQPSAARDLCVPPVFPTAPFILNRKKIDSIRKDIIYAPDPCVLRIGRSGLEIAVTSSEPVQALSSIEFHRSADQENNDRMARLNSHLLTQQSLYPLEPAELPTSLEDLLEVGTLSASPHILFVPSRLAPYAKVVGQSLFVNSSTLAKGHTGSYVKMSINMHAGELSNQESVADYSEIQIMRI
ncbi:unnamed protein product [Caenorhabditis sp. 36 PRJEB53466]|nr:unnamed protein product [Caenorhabditis sp. 36 PRJEB53466]